MLLLHYVLRFSVIQSVGDDDKDEFVLKRARTHTQHTYVLGKKELRGRKNEDERRSPEETERVSINVLPILLNKTYIKLLAFTFTFIS
jgi:hypothetical protein